MQPTPHNKKIGRVKLFIAVALCVSTLGMGTLGRPAPAEAQGNAVIGAAAGLIGCYIGGLLAQLIPTQVPVNDSTDNTKDCFYDGIAKGFANAVLQDITHSIVNWILTGFEGRPMFVQDLDSYLLSIVDQAAGEYIYGSELGFLCSPFELDIRIALAFQYLGDPNPVACTLTEALGNVDDFFAGDFSQGGFPRWLEVFSRPQNNPYGAAQVAEATLQARLGDKEFNARQILDFGDGFLSYEKCETPEEGDHPGREASTKEYCYITTPGQVISEQLTFQLETGSLQLIEADEINESISAIVSALAYKALSTGLANLNNDGYLNDFKDEPVPQKELEERVGNVEDEPGAGGTVHGGSSESMVWKAVSEKDGRLVVLTPTSFGTPSVRILDSNGNTIETGDYSGHHNGNRAHYRFNRSGGGYPANVILAVDGNRYCIANPGVDNRPPRPCPQGTGGGGSSTGGSSPSGGGSGGSDDPTRPNPTVSGPGGEPHPNPAPGIL